MVHQRGRPPESRDRPFFHAAGLLILEGIGMTENTSFSNVNRYDNYRFRLGGPPGPRH
jgi:long-chain acyl-CoA synthetase